MSIKNVTLLGADGNLGPAVLHALTHKFAVTVFKRDTSKSPDDYPPGVKVVRISEAFSLDELADKLRGQDAMVVTIKGSQTDVQRRIADACVRAGVRRLVPADFGSCDSSSPRARELVPLFARKTELREYLIGLAAAHPDFTWTSLVTAHFFDWRPEFLHLFPREKQANVLGDGETRFSASTLARIGEATCRVLEKADETSNRVLFVQSFCVTQRQVVAAFERATGAEWKVTALDVAEFEKERKAKSDEGDLEAVEDLVWLLGTLDANWETKDGFAMKLLGLQNEDLDQVVKDIVKRSS